LSRNEIALGTRERSSGSSVAPGKETSARPFPPVTRGPRRTPPGGIELGLHGVEAETVGFTSYGIAH
jgi:hypothetical protein